MNKNIKRILAYGCSYTAGAEIMDHVIMGVSFEECNQRKTDYLKNSNGESCFIKFNQDFNIKSNDPLIRYSSWAGQLANLLNLEFENRARSGSGLDEQYLKILDDYNQGLILEEDLVLVGLTNIDRIPDFRSKEKITTLLCQNIPDDIGSKLLLDIFNDDYLIFQYFKNLILLNSLNSKMQLKMQPLSVTMLDEYLTSLNITNNKQFTKDVWNGVIDNMLLPEEFLKRPVVNGKEVVCGFLHPPLESHIELAEKIYNQIKF